MITNEIKNYLKYYLGMVKLGDYVVYIPDVGNLGKTRKGIWKIISIDIADHYNNDYHDYNNVTIQSIHDTNRSFNTDLYKLIDVKYIFNSVITDVINIEEFFTPISLNQYNSIISNSKIQETETIQLVKKETKMGNQMVGKVIDNNVRAAKNGALISAGKTLNGVLRERIAKQLPRKYRALSSHPLADVVIANVASFAVQNFAANNHKAQVAANAMMEAAMMEFFNSFNLDSIIQDVLVNVDLSEVEV